MPRNQKLTRLRLATGAFRALPDFVIIGAQKCGTSSLYHYLAQHPDVAPAARKEVHFFDWSFGRGVNWYKAHFALNAQCAVRRALGGPPLVVGEASPYYLVHPHVPERVKQLLPRVKLIVLLRDPVERTVSAHQHQMRRGREVLPLADALEQEPARLIEETARLERDPAYNSEVHRHFSYLARGIYVDQLTRWFQVFPREQFLVLNSADFFSDTASVFAHVLTFLGLRQWEPREYRRFNAAEYDALEPSMRSRLVDYFAPHNRRLYELLGKDFGWPR